MKRLVVILVTVVALVGFMTAGSALADTYYGALWDPNYSGITSWNVNADNPSLGAPSTISPPTPDTPTATFTVPSINFSSSTPETYGAWLNNTFAVGSEPSANWIQNTQFYTVSGDAPYVGTFFQFTWEETFITDVLLTIALTHDDGAYLTMDGGVLINSSPPTVAITNTFSGIISAGTHNFVLNYGGVNGFPEVLIYSQSAESIPLPPTALLLGTGLLGLAGLGYRRKRKS